MLSALKNNRNTVAVGGHHNHSILHYAGILHRWDKNALGGWRNAQSGWRNAQGGDRNTQGGTEECTIFQMATKKTNMLTT